MPLIDNGMHDLYIYYIYDNIYARLAILKRAGAFKMFTSDW
jgi:hypothetical protein